MFLGDPEKRKLGYVLQCHVTEKHKLCSSALMSTWTYVPRDMFLSYVPRQQTYVS
jgi:hypothetical protein